MTAALPAAQPPKKPQQQKTKPKKTKPKPDNPASGTSGDKKQKTKGKKSKSKSQQHRAKKGGEQVNGKDYKGGQYAPPDSGSTGRSQQAQQPPNPEREIYYDYDQLHEAAREFAKTLAYEMGHNTRQQVDASVASYAKEVRKQTSGNWILNSMFWVFITMVGSSATAIANLNVLSMVPGMGMLTSATGTAGQVDVSQLDMSPATVGKTANGFTITSNYGYRSAPTAGATSDHDGVDVGADPGTPLYAPAAGTVRCYGDGGYKYDKTANVGGYGPYALEFESGDPNVPDFFIGHNDGCISGAKTPGQKMGAIGNRGVSTGPHAHITQYDANGQPTQPQIGFINLIMGAPVPLIKGSTGILDDNFITLAIGNAEGTRTPDGGYNPGYYGHTDPGNGAANIGSFSYQVYQGGASTPKQADALQLRRLNNALADAKAKGFTPETQAELINFLDLWNQAPRAAESFPARLQQAKAQGLNGDSAILKARVDSFRTSSGAISASGLGHSESRLRADQQRRMTAMNRVIR